MNKLFAALVQGIQLLPTFIISIETLFGQQTGATKKQAVQALAQASIAGAAYGLGVVGDDSAAQILAGFAPVVSSTIDNIVTNLNTAGVFKPAPVSTTGTAATQSAAA